MPTIVTTNCSVSVLCNTKQKTAYEIMPSLVGSEMCITVSHYSRQSPNTIRAAPATPDATPARMGVTFEAVCVGADGVVRTAPGDGDGEGAGVGAGGVAGVVGAVFRPGVGAGVVAGVIGAVFEAGVGVGVAATVVGVVFEAGVGAGVVAGVANVPVSSIAVLKIKVL